MAPQSNAHDQQQASTNYKEAFSLFDKRGNGRVALESLGDLLRACGQNPTLAEISDLEKGIGGDCESLPLDCFYYCLFSFFFFDSNGLPANLIADVVNYSRL